MNLKATKPLTLTASSLVSLLKILGALVLDYSSNPKAPMSKELLQFVKVPAARWKILPGLQDAISSAVSGKNKLDTLYQLGVELKSSFLENFYNSQEYTSQELKMLRAIRSYLMTDSENALIFIEKNAALFEDPELSSKFLPESTEKVDSAALRRSVKSLSGRDGVSLKGDEVLLLKDTNPKGYEAYQVLRKAHNKDFKNSLMVYVRSQKKSLVQYEAAYAALNAMGFTESMVPGFKGLIDDQGKWYTKDGDLINGVPNLFTYTHVLMNTGKDPDNKWVFKAFKPDGTYSQAYTCDFQRAQSKSKYDHVRELMTKIQKIRSKWIAKVKAFDSSNKESVAAVVLEILYSFAARIGSAPGRGVGTLLVKNVTITQAGLNLSYIGKDGIPTKHVLKSSDPVHKFLIHAIQELIEDKGKNDFIFQHWDGKKWIRCSPTDVNAAFRLFGAPQSVSVHKLRTCRGTTLFKQLIDQLATKRPPRDEKEALNLYRLMTEKVGKLLNHKRGVGGSNEQVTGLTAARSYIDADLQISLFQAWGFRVPKHLEKLAQE